MLTVRRVAFFYGQHVCRIGVMDSTTSRTDKVIASYIRELMESKGITQAKISEVLAGRSKGYVSDRILGKRSWAISELDRIAPLFGLPDALSLIAAAAGRAATILPPSVEEELDTPLTAAEAMALAANKDPNRDMEEETPRD